MQAGEDVWYKASNDIVPGAYYLDSYDYNNSYPIEMFETITAYANGKETIITQTTTLILCKKMSWLTP